jgi:hypothetical protein
MRARSGAADGGARPLRQLPAAGRSGAASERGGGSGSSSGPRYFNWVIDAHPEDINKLDFKRPNGEAVMRTIADYRQITQIPFEPNGICRGLIVP